MTMQRIARTLTVFVLSLMSISLFSQGIEFFHGTWVQALEKSKAEGRLIFVDAYAEWCGPCKKMAAQTFPDAKVGAFFNANFICLKMDMEKEENAEFVGKYPVSAFPTLMFIDQNGKIVVKQTGAQGIDGLIELGQKAISKADKLPELQARYEEGERDPQFLLQYVGALNRASKPSLKVTNDYLNTQKDITTPFNLGFILEGAAEADSRVFDLLIKYRTQIEQQAGKNAVQSRIEKACLVTLNKAIEYKDEKLLQEAKDKMKAFFPEKATDFANNADIKYFTATKNAKAYLKAMKNRQKQVGNNAARLHELCLEMVRAFPSDPKVLQQAQKWAETAAKNGGLAEYHMTLADIYKRLGDKTKARNAAQEARKTIGDKDTLNMSQKIDYFLEHLD